MVRTTIMTLIRHTSRVSYTGTRVLECEFVPEGTRKGLFDVWSVPVKWPPQSLYDLSLWINPH